MKKYGYCFHKFIRSTLSPEVFSSYQNEKCAWDEVYVYTVILAIDLTKFPNASVQYDARYFD